MRRAVIFLVVLADVANAAYGLEMERSALVCRAPHQLAGFVEHFKSDKGPDARAKTFSVMYTSMVAKICEVWPKGQKYHATGQDTGRYYYQVYRHNQRGNYWWAHSCTMHPGYFDPSFCAWANKKYKDK